MLFKEGDTDKRTFYLVSGQVELRADDRVMGVIKSGTAEARAALAPGLPRKFTARAAMDIEYIMIDSDLLDVLLTWDQTGQYEVAELRGDGLDVTGDWMTTLLQTKAFHRIPPANIQAIFMRMQRINYRAGDIVIKQGTEGDFFYVVVAGKCTVNARDAPEQGRHQAGGTGSWRQLRRGSIDCGGQAQRHGHHVQRRHLDASWQK